MTGTQPAELRVMSGVFAGQRHPVGRGLTLGRSPGADVILLDLACSRTHARVERTRHGYALVDEGSANGTWLDGQRIPPHQRHLLDDGDQFLVGEIVFELAYAQVPSPAARAVLRGDLQRLSFTDLIQLLDMTQQSGVLRIEHPRGEGLLSFVGGELTDVQGGDESDPLESFFAFACLRRGRFEFLEDDARLSRRFRRPTQRLLVEAARRLDER